MSDGVDLLFELGDALGSAAGNGLVGGGDDGFQAKCFMQWGQRHQGNDGGAVRIGDDVFRVIASGGGIDLGHDERHSFIHAEGR